MVLCLKLHLYELLNINCYVSFQINRRAIASPGPEGRRVAGLEGHWDSFGGCCPTRSGCGHHWPLLWAFICCPDSCRGVSSSSSTSCRLLLFFLCIIFPPLLSSLLMVTTKCLFSRKPFELYGLATVGTRRPP